MPPGLSRTFGERPLLGWPNRSKSPATRASAGSLGRAVDGTFRNQELRCNLAEAAVATIRASGFVGIVPTVLHDLHREPAAVWAKRRKQNHRDPQSTPTAKGKKGRQEGSAPFSAAMPMCLRIVLVGCPLQDQRLNNFLGGLSRLDRWGRLWQAAPRAAKEGPWFSAARQPEVGRAP